MLENINRKHANNSVYFGAMHHSIDHDAAPMRIPFSRVPGTGLEDEAPSRRAAARKSAASADELFLLRERQFKVTAENAHSESQRARARAPALAQRTSVQGRRKRLAVGAHERTRRGSREDRQPVLSRA